MLKTVIILPDGTEVSSGSGNVNAIQKSTIIECVNSGEELTIGSTCANSFEATLFTPNGDFSIPAGTEVKVAKEDENGTRWDVGVFVMEKPTRLTANTMKLVGYDRVSKLDKDLTSWLSGLAGWPYALNTFANMICSACGIPFKSSSVPNGDYQIQKFTRSSVTGRQLMRWLGEICCSFCRADKDGNIEFAWYQPTDLEIKATGDHYYFQNGLTYEDYEVAPVEAVQIRLADSENGALWPMLGDGINSYIITGNPFLTRNLDQTILQPILNNILARLTSVSYRPCKVDLPASMNIHAGNTVLITDKNGITFTGYVMTKTQSGQKDTLECTGSARRDSSSAVNNKTQAEKDAAMENYASSVASNAVKAQTADEILRQLTNDYQIQGIWQENGQWYFNAQAVHVINLVADLITAGKLSSQDGSTFFDLEKGIFASKGENGHTITLENGRIVLKDPNGNTRFNIAYFSSGEVSAALYNSSGIRIGGLMDFDGDLAFVCRDTNGGHISGRRVGWKEIEYVDSKGIIHNSTVLAAY